MPDESLYTQVTAVLRAEIGASGKAGWLRDPVPFSAIARLGSSEILDYRLGKTDVNVMPKPRRLMYELVVFRKPIRRFRPRIRGDRGQSAAREQQAIPGGRNRGRSARARVFGGLS